MITNTVSVTRELPLDDVSAIEQGILRDQFQLRRALMEYDTRTSPFKYAKYYHQVVAGIATAMETTAIHLTEVAYSYLRGEIVYYFNVSYLDD